MFLISAIAGFTIGKLIGRADDDSSSSRSGRSTYRRDYTTDYGSSNRSSGCGGHSHDSDEYSSYDLDKGLRDFNRLLERDLLKNGCKVEDNRDYSYKDEGCKCGSGGRSNRSSGRRTSSPYNYSDCRDRAFLERLLDYYDSKKR